MISITRKEVLAQIQEQRAAGFSDAEIRLTRAEAAAFLGVRANTLASWACSQKFALRYCKIGKTATYRLSDLLAFVESRVAA